MAADRPPGQAAQPKPRDEPLPHPPEENAESSLSTSSELQAGQFRSQSASTRFRSFSKICPHSVQRYSKIGMRGQFTFLLPQQ